MIEEAAPLVVDLLHGKTLGKVPLDAKSVMALKMYNAELNEAAEQPADDPIRRWVHGE